MNSKTVSGQTVHSNLSLPVGMRNRRRLRGLALEALQLRLEGVDYLLVEEASMLSLELLGWICLRLKESRPETEHFTGGISVILVGDVGQLPPVEPGSQPFYALKATPRRRTRMTIARVTDGLRLFGAITTVWWLQFCHRQRGDDQKHWRQLLWRCRMGELSLHDFNFLKKRMVESAVTPFNNLHLYSKRKSVHEYNLQQLAVLPGAPVFIEAEHDTSKAKNVPSKQAGGLAKTLWLKVGAKVMLTSNVATPCGLTNGARGKV